MPPSVHPETSKMGEPCGTHSLTLEKAYKGVFIKKKKKGLLWNATQPSRRRRLLTLTKICLELEKIVPSAGGRRKPVSEGSFYVTAVKMARE